MSARLNSSCNPKNPKKMELLRISSQQNIWWELCNLKKRTSGENLCTGKGNFFFWEGTTGKGKCIISEPRELERAGPAHHRPPRGSDPKQKPSRSLESEVWAGDKPSTIPNSRPRQIRRRPDRLISCASAPTRGGRLGTICGRLLSVLASVFVIGDWTVQSAWAEVEMGDRAISSKSFSVGGFYFI